MLDKIISTIQYLYSKGYLETAAIALGTWIYQIVHKFKKTKYTRIKCPKCGGMIPLKDGRPYQKEKKK